MQTYTTPVSLESLTDEDPDPDLRTIGKDRLIRFFDINGGTYCLKKTELVYKPFYY